MDGESVQQIERLVKQTFVHNINGKFFSPAKMSVVSDDRNVEQITVSTLTGLIQYINSSIDVFDIKKMLCVVDGPTQVRFFSCIKPENLSRDYYIKSTMSDSVTRFKFNQFMNQEEFIIGVKSLFQHTADQDRLISYVSKLSIKSSVEVLDDGISQSATVNKGMSGAIKENQPAPSVVSLAPYRTFGEISQPESMFIFRMRQSSGESSPSCALFEADGGIWRNEAMSRIQKFITAGIKDLTVIA